MAKIKGWKKTQDKDNYEAWYSTADKPKISAVAIRRNNKVNMQTMKVSGYDYTLHVLPKGEDVKNYNFDNYESAKKEAMKIMRGN